ncbi:prophage antirepressor-like protein [Paraburkholderia sp. HC6.4b]|uniref:BRO-N domain-containing protein n=1 Tax=unclassified Paraburkholderia TaxID=2615204 RepID=UPI0016177E08|nr:MULTISPECIES: Bro-N domain-containing protein [unclassified Paraburkholderia]MBB5411860.1 prophage antirepressor-like protein [Paraburkholderia sp. HC6.4b]MBB5450172.1 prophage antirepressor-like protein [Paraburkholderia sp. Kb1A]
MSASARGALAPVESPFSFEFESYPMRVIVIDGEPWFVAADLCHVLKIANSRDALLKLDDDEKGVGLTDTLGGQQNVAIVSESGMYTLVLRCRDAVKPGTLPHRFRKWVTAEVLPQIRKTGQYGSDPLKLLQNGRWLLSFDDDGRARLSPVAEDAFVTSPEHIMQLLAKRGYILAKPADKSAFGGLQ